MTPEDAAKTASQLRRVLAKDSILKPAKNEGGAVMTPARHLSDLSTVELIDRLFAYMKLEGQCLGALESRGAYAKELYDNARAAFDDGRNCSRGEDETAAVDWLRFIVNESFYPVFEDPEEELERIQRYLVTASLICTEAGDLPDD